MRGGGIAGDHNGLDPLGNQETGILIGKLADGFRAFGAIGQSRSITEIQDVLRWQQFLHRPHDGESADA
jgi:hypothetical protein